MAGRVLKFPRRHVRASASRKSSADTRPLLIDLKQAIKSQDGRLLPRRMRLIVLRSTETREDLRTSEAISSSSSPRSVIKSDRCMSANVHEAHIAVKPDCAWGGMEPDFTSVHDMHMGTSAKRKTAPAPLPPVRYQSTFMRLWRKSKGKTLEEMAEKIGMTHGQLSKIETGKQPYSQTILEAYAKELDCSVIDLLSRAPNEAEHVLSAWYRANAIGRKMIAAAARITEE